MWMLGRKPNSVFAAYEFTTFLVDAGWAMFDFSQSGIRLKLVVIETHWGLPSSTETVIDARMRSLEQKEKCD